MARTGWPGIKILMFAFGDDTANEHLPHNYTDCNLVVYAGTHDNETIVGYFRDKTDYELAQRPAGQSAKSWMDENGICEQSYYHWQRRFRKQAYEEMKGNSSVPAVTEKTELSFVEIPCHTSAETNTYMVSDKPVATIRTATLQIDISNEISDALLSRIIQEVSHA